MNRRHSIIMDQEINEEFGDAAIFVIDGLDRNPATQKSETTHGRDRSAVDAWLRENGYRAVDHEQR